MLITEFEERTGLKVSESNYKNIELTYMETNLDKDEFCKMWMETPDSAKIQLDYMSKMIISEREVTKSWKNLYKEECEKREMANIKLGQFLADEAHEYASIKAREKAIELMGFKCYIAYVLAKEWNLWEIDKTQIIDNLK